MGAYQIEDAPSVVSGRSRARSRHGDRRSHRSSSHYDDRHHSSHYDDRHRSSSHYDDRRTIVSRPASHYGDNHTIARRHTHHDITVQNSPRPTTARSHSATHIDMDLAYGNASPEALSRYSPPSPEANQKKLDGLVIRAHRLLEEAHCVQHGATATIAHLQQNPDAMAAVGLTLAEISNLARKMAPSALTGLRAAAPAIFALLSSPQFLIAAGVGLGATVIMFGGYKIIQRMKAGAIGEDGKVTQPQQETEMEEMIEFNPEAVGSVEMWRRGVADTHAHSVGTSVDGEFITPTAAAMSGIDITTARARRDPRFKFEEDVSVASSRRSRRSRSTRAPNRAPSNAPTYVPSHAPSERHERRSRAPSEAPSGFLGRSSSRSAAPSKAPSRAPGQSRAPSRAPSKAHTYVSETEKKPMEKKNRSSRLRLMFTSSH